ncbi:MAG: hypothetical protein LBG42_03745 [Treponema sp.]|nr:hypothetical protein [Treponema sp.]
MAKCSSTKKAFGIRIEQRGRDWVRTWAFPIDERKAKREGFDANTISGSMNAGDEYPGCPHCGNIGFAQCGCGKTGCGGGIIDNGDGTAEMTCPWCGETSIYSAAGSFDVKGGGF